MAINKINLFLSFIITLFLTSCASNKNSNSNFTALDYFNVQAQKPFDIQKKQTEQIDLDSLYSWQEIYLEVEPGVSKWVNVRNITEYQYDDNNLLKEEKSDIETINYTYTKDKMLFMKNSSISGNSMYLYNSLGLVSSIIGDKYTEQNEYDAKGNKIKTNSSSHGTQLFEYDALGRKTRVIFTNKNYIATYTYLYENNSWNPPLKHTYSAKITNNIDNTEMYIDVVNDNIVKEVWIENNTYTYCKTVRYNENSLISYVSDSIKGNFWYKYIYDANNNPIKKIEFMEKN